METPTTAVDNTIPLVTLPPHPYIMDSKGIQLKDSEKSAKAGSGNSDKTFVPQRCPKSVENSPYLKQSKTDIRDKRFIYAALQILLATAPKGSLQMPLAESKMYTLLWCPLMLTLMHCKPSEDGHDGAHRCFTPKYRRFLDILTYPRGSRSYSTIQGCECLHPVYGSENLDLKPEGEYLVNAEPRHCMHAFVKETGNTFNRIASLYARFYALRFVALLISAKIRKNPVTWDLLTKLLGSSMRMATLSTLYLYSHMSVHRLLMCSLVPKPLGDHPFAYWLCAGTAASLIVMEEESRVKSINRMLMVYNLTEAIQYVWRAINGPVEEKEDKLGNLNVKQYPGLLLLAYAIYSSISRASQKTGRLTLPWKTYGIGAVSAWMM